MIEVGIVGCGGMGSFHTRVLMGMTDKVKIKAIADIRQEKIEKFCNELGAAKYGDGIDLLANEKLDAVFIFLPTYLHAEYSIYAMENGMDVFVEKPLCLTEKEASLIIEVEKRTGRKMMVGHVVRFAKQWDEIKKIAGSKKYGEILSADFKRMSPRTQKSLGNWFNDPQKSGGVALDLMVHDVDYMRYLIGEPKNITPRAVYNDTGDIEYITAVYDYDNAYATVSACWDSCYDLPFISGFRIVFEKATAVMENWKLTVYEKGNGKKEFSYDFKTIKSEEASDINVSVVNGYDSEDEYFIDCVANNRPIEKCTVSDAAESIKLIYKTLSVLKGEK